MFIHSSFDVVSSIQRDSDSCNFVQDVKFHHDYMSCEQIVSCFFRFVANALGILQHKINKINCVYNTNDVFKSKSLNWFALEIAN